MAGVTKSDLFYYIDPKGSLLLEKKSRDGSFAVLYGSPVEAVAWSADEKQIALLCKGDSATEVGVYQHKNSQTPEGKDGNKSVIRVLNVVDDEVAYLGDLVDEIIVSEASALNWMHSTNHIISSKPGLPTTIVSLKDNKLKFALKDDSGSLPFSVLQVLALTNDQTQVVTFWDMQKNQSVETFPVPNRKARKGTSRVVCSTTSDGNFSFLMNNDATLHSVYITKGSIRHLVPMIALFSPFCRRPRKDEQVYSYDGAFKVVSHAISSSQVLVGVTGSPDIYKFKYLKKEVTLKPVEKQRIPHSEVLLALSLTRYLAIERDGEGGQKYVVRPLELGPLPSQERAKEKEKKKEAREAEGTAEATPQTTEAKAARAAPSKAEGKTPNKDKSTTNVDPVAHPKGGKKKEEEKKENEEEKKEKGGSNVLLLVGTAVVVAGLVGAIAIRMSKS